MTQYSLTYDDIQLVPAISSIKSRQDIKLHTRVSRNYKMLTPLVASPMDTVCEEEMAFKMFVKGGVGCIHRFMIPIEQQRQIRMLYHRIYGEGFGGPGDEWLTELYDEPYPAPMVPIMAAIGVSEEDKRRARGLVEAGANILLIDVAHGHHTNVEKMLKYCKDKFPTIDVIAGNIATAKAAEDLQAWGADGLRVGIGGGCFTPNMEVKTEKGFIKIKDIEIGTNVYTHTGELKPVINKFEYDHYKEFYDIDGIEATHNHKFYVVHESKADLVTDDNIHDYAEWIKAEDLTDEYFLIELD